MLKCGAVGGARRSCGALPAPSGAWPGCLWSHTPPRLSFLLSVLSPLLVLCQDAEGRAPIHVAISNQHSVIIQLLISHPDIRLNIRDRQGMTPFACAMTHKNNKAAEAIIKREPGAAEQVPPPGSALWGQRPPPARPDSASCLRAGGQQGAQLPPRGRAELGHRERAVPHQRPGQRQLQGSGRGQAQPAAPGRSSRLGDHRPQPGTAPSQRRTRSGPPPPPRPF